MTPDQFRRMALLMPDAVEGAHHGHPDFRVNGRVFASLHSDGHRGMVKVSPQEQGRIVRQSPSDFAPATGAWGRAGCTMVQLATVAANTLRDAMTLAWQEVALAPTTKRTSASGGKRTRPTRPKRAR